MQKTSALALVAITLALLAALTYGTVTQDSHAQGDRAVEVLLVETEENGPYAFRPQEIQVAPGTTVRWVLDHDVFHTVTSTDSQERRSPNDVFQATLAASGDDFEYTFTEAGEFHYYCQPHAGFMYGTVNVRDENGAPGPAALVAVMTLLALLLLLRQR